jgi:hypothetical protein
VDFLITSAIADLCQPGYVSVNAAAVSDHESGSYTGQRQHGR